MIRCARGLAAAVAVGGLAVGLVRAADDDKAAKPAEPPAKMDWSGFANASEVVGTVVDTSDHGFTLRVSWYTPGRGRNGRPGRPQEHHADHVLTFAEGGLVRWKKLQPKLGEAKPNYTFEELNKLKLPTGAPGYAAPRDELKSGHVVEVHLVRPRDIPAKKADPTDLKVKYAVILGENPNPIKK